MFPVHRSLRGYVIQFERERYFMPTHLPPNSMGFGPDEIVKYYVQNFNVPSDAIGKSSQYQTQYSRSSNWQPPGRGLDSARGLDLPGLRGPGQQYLITNWLAVQCMRNNSRPVFLNLARDVILILQLVNFLKPHSFSVSLQRQRCSDQLLSACLLPTR